jgi:hypothetical protein
MAARSGRKSVVENAFAARSVGSNPACMHMSQADSNAEEFVEECAHEARAILDYTFRHTSA